MLEAIEAAITHYHTRINEIAHTSAAWAYDGMNEDLEMYEYLLKRKEAERDTLLENAG